MPESRISDSRSTDNTTESFKDILSEYERNAAKKSEQRDQSREGTVVAITPDSVVVDVGLKTEGILPLTSFQGNANAVRPGDKLLVSIKGRDPEGYYELSRGSIQRPRDWAALETAFAEKTTIAGTVTSLIKGGLSVDVGVRAFMPLSRSGARDASELEKLVGQEIRCRITKLDATEEDVVVDRRTVLEEEARSAKSHRYSELREGDTVQGTVRSLMDYGAFIDLGGVDALLHVSDIAWARVPNPADVLSVGQELEVKILKVAEEAGKQRISVGMRQLQPDPWNNAAAKYRVGERARGAVTRVLDFGAFVELEPGIEGLIHVSEMSWTKKVRTPADVVKPGDIVEVIVLGLTVPERRISLGLKQALGDPWVGLSEKFPVGSIAEGQVTSLTKFGAFVQISEGVEGMIHISEISVEKRIHHPQDALKIGQPVRAEVLAIDPERRILRLSMKRMLPTTFDEYVSEHKQGDVVTGRVVEVSGAELRVELGEGIQGTCNLQIQATQAQAKATADGASANTDLASLTSMLRQRWKSGSSASGSSTEAVRPGQIGKFRIRAIDGTAKKIILDRAQP